MDISEFMNQLGQADLNSFVKILEALKEARLKGFSHIEYFGYHKGTGNIFCSLEDNITIYSGFGCDAFYSPSDDENKEFNSLDELVEYLKK